MIKLNLKANNQAEQLIKEYLEKNVSEELASKINNGVTITKDNKTLINKKDLKGFMNFANEEARKLAEKGAKYACIEHTTVFGWAIHYFEEASIEGNLYNEDGTEYKVAIKPSAPSKLKKEAKQENPKEENLQATLFDMLTENSTQEEKEPELVEKVKQEIEETIQEDNLIIDKETGEILTNNQQNSSFDDEVTTSLFSIFQNNLEAK